MTLCLTMISEKLASYWPLTSKRTIIVVRFGLVVQGQEFFIKRDLTHQKGLLRLCLRILFPIGCRCYRVHWRLLVVPKSFCDGSRNEAGMCQDVSMCCHYLSSDGLPRLLMLALVLLFMLVKIVLVMLPESSAPLALPSFFLLNINFETSIGVTFCLLFISLLEH